MNFFLKKAYYKIFDKEKYSEIKFGVNKEKEIKAFKSKLETCLNDVQKKLQTATN